MATNLKKTIMRRVYYSYALSVVESRAFVQGVVFGACVAVLGRLTHVAALIHNFLSVPIGNLPKYVGGTVANALGHGEVLTVLVTVLMVGVSLSFTKRVIEQFSYRTFAM